MIMYLYDTNLIAELMRPMPDAIAARWLNLNFADSWICAPVIFESLSGLVRLPEGGRRSQLIDVFERLLQRFGPRVQDFDTRSARAAAQLIEAARRQGRVLQEGDAQIAGIAAAYGLVLATRNIRDFEGLGLQLVNPWLEA
jgi:toxin FitB